MIKRLGIALQCDDRDREALLANRPEPRSISDLNINMLFGVPADDIHPVASLRIGRDGVSWINETIAPPAATPE